MPAVMEQIDRMTTGEKFKTMDYIWSSLKTSWTLYRFSTVLR